MFGWSVAKLHFVVLYFIPKLQIPDVYASLHGKHLFNEKSGKIKCSK